MMNNTKKIEKILLKIRARSILLKNIDTEMTNSSSEIPMEVKELLYGVVTISEDIFIDVDKCQEMLYK